MRSEPGKGSPKKRVETSPAQDPLVHLGTVADVFAGLDLPALPPGPEVSPPPEPVWKMGRVVLRKETAHRGGKVVIVAHDFATHLPASLLEGLAKKLRAGCGCGGAVKGRTIEIQGDQAPRVRALLEAEGFQVAGVK